MGVGLSQTPIFRAFVSKNLNSRKGLITCRVHSEKCSKKDEKIVDTPQPLWDIAPTHGNTQNNKMRTKTLLLAAALTAAGLATSLAQSNVYSLNVVGYVNVNVAGNKFNMMSAPLNFTGAGGN